MRSFTVLIIFVLFASIAGGFFVLKQEKEIIIENVPTAGALTPGADGETPAVEPIPEELISKAQSLVSEAQKFIEEEQAKLALVVQVKEKSTNIKGIYTGAVRNFESFKALLGETKLNALVIDIKEGYGTNLSPSLKNSILDLHQKDVWAIARIVLFRDSSLMEEKPEWYLASTTDATSTSSGQATSTVSLWQDKAGQYWLDPQNPEVQDYIINFSKKAIDFGFDELQFDYIRYPDDYEFISGEEKIKVIGDLFSKLSDSLRAYKPSIILSVDLFGYVATQFNSYGTGQRLFDAGKYFDYLSFMLYPSHFYGGFSAKGVIYSYPEVVGHPYEVVYYSVASARDYLSLFGLETRIRPWLQDFDLKIDKDREVFYDAEKVKLQIEAAQNATSSGWLLWNPSYIYTRDALATSTQNSSSTQLIP